MRLPEDAMNAGADGSALMLPRCHWHESMLDAVQWRFHSSLLYLILSSITLTMAITDLCVRGSERLVGRSAVDKAISN